MHIAFESRGERTQETMYYVPQKSELEFLNDLFLGNEEFKENIKTLRKVIEKHCSLYKALCCIKAECYLGLNGLVGDVIHGDQDDNKYRYLQQKFRELLLNATNTGRSESKGDKQEDNESGFIRYYDRNGKEIGYSQNGKFYRVAACADYNALFIVDINKDDDLSETNSSKEKKIHDGKENESKYCFYTFSPFYTYYVIQHISYKEQEGWILLDKSEFSANNINNLIKFKKEIYGYIDNMEVENANAANDDKVTNEAADQNNDEKQEDKSYKNLSRSMNKVLLFFLIEQNGIEYRKLVFKYTKKLLETLEVDDKTHREVYGNAFITFCAVFRPLCFFPTEELFETLFNTICQIIYVYNGKTSDETGKVLEDRLMISLIERIREWEIAALKDETKVAEENEFKEFVSNDMDNDKDKDKDKDKDNDKDEDKDEFLGDGSGRLKIKDRVLFKKIHHILQYEGVTPESLFFPYGRESENSYPTYLPSKLPGLESEYDVACSWFSVLIRLILGANEMLFKKYTVNIGYPCITDNNDVEKACSEFWDAIEELPKPSKQTDKK